MARVKSLDIVRRDVEDFFTLEEDEIPVFVIKEKGITVRTQKGSVELYDPHEDVLYRFVLFKRQNSGHEGTFATKHQMQMFFVYSDMVLKLCRPS